MPRRDRTFSHFDVVRLACRNLDEIEKAKFKAELRGVLGQSGIGMDSLLSLVCTLDREKATEFIEKMCADPCGFNPRLSTEAGLAAYGNIDRAHWSAMRRAFLIQILMFRDDWHQFNQDDIKAVLSEIFKNEKSTHYINHLEFCEWLIPINDFTAQATNMITTLQFLPIVMFGLIAIFPVSTAFLLKVIAAILAYETVLTSFNLAFIAINAFFVFALIPIMGCGDFGTGVPKYVLEPPPTPPDLSGIPPYGSGL